VLTARVVLPGLPSSVPTARHFVESILTAWGAGETAWTGALLVSELAANSTLHARSEFGVRVTRSHDQVLIEVHDASPRVPQPRAYGLQATTGRGLHLVESLSANWGVRPTPEGKTVWVELPAGAHDDREPADVDLDGLLTAFPDDPTRPVD
jgi:anti-sigma regulatory factor (Ser/Thr protein kinase)